MAIGCPTKNLISVWKSLGKTFLLQTLAKSILVAYDREKSYKDYNMMASYQEEERNQTTFERLVTIGENL